MTLTTGPDYLETLMRRAGAMDHDFYPWRDTWSERRLTWNNGKTLGVWLQIAVEWFPLDLSGKPFLPIGAPNRPWPDSETYTQRDYGHRYGIYRLMDAIRVRKLKASAFLNARVAERYPLLIRAILAENWEVVAAGLDAGAIHHEGLGVDEERAMIAEALAILSRHGADPVAWHSPSWSQSTRTPTLLKQAGINAMADWVNDEAPYLFATEAGPIVSLPTTIDLSDRDMIGVHKQNLADVEASVLAAARRLAREAEESGHGRLLTLNFSPWLMGQPYRIAAFERMLDAIFAISGSVAVSVPDILAASHDLGDAR
jgi:peptidoglycan/xylan/chitin deacetylase (PgdA/CDA1 family)